MDLLAGVQAKPGMSKTETYEERTKALFIKEPANMRLLVVVDKLLTGFDAPPCSFLYIDKSMHDHGLFQAICRTNRLDGEDKEFGYIVDYKDLFKSVENAIAVYTSELDQSSDEVDSQVLLQDRLAQGKESLDDALEALALLCEPIAPPKDELAHIHYFCGNTEVAQDLQNREPLRVALYKAVVVLLRAYANLADEMEAAGYSAVEIGEIKCKRDRYLKLRELIRMASGETLDIKPFEADMRHLIDTYIEASEPRKISDFDNIGLLELIVKTGIGQAIAEKLSEMNGNRGAVAETIENNVRSKIIKENLTDPAYFAKMSALLDEIIKLRKEKAIEYEEYLKRIGELAIKVHAGKAQGTPQALNSLGKLALYNNLIPKNTVSEPATPYGASSGDAVLDLALKIDSAVKQARPDGWRGVQAKEMIVKQAMYNVLSNVEEVERLFPIIVAQQEY